MKTEARQEGAIRLAATSGAARGETIEALALELDEVVVGTRRLDLATLAERPSKPLANPARVKLVLEGGDQERILARADEQGVAITSFESAQGCEVRVHALRTGQRRALAVGQPKTLAASISPNGKCVIVLDEEGGVLCYDVAALAYPDSARARKPPPGSRASIDLARGARLWLVAAGTSIEVRMMRDEKAVATVDLPPLGDEVTCAIFLPDASGFLVGTADGVVMRFELLLDRVGSSRDARVAAIADGVDAAIAGTSWTRYAPRVDVYDERTENGRTTLYFVADHYEYHQLRHGVRDRVPRRHCDPPHDQRPALPRLRQRPGRARRLVDGGCGRGRGREVLRRGPASIRLMLPSARREARYDATAPHSQDEGGARRGPDPLRLVHHPGLSGLSLPVAR